MSWGAILAGAVANGALTLALLTAGAGLGFTSISPFAGSGVSATTLGISALAWVVLIQILAMGGGGYLAGRLRTKSVGPHTPEAAMRDTAHGFLSWAVGSIIGALLLASAASSIVGGAARLGASAASGVGQAVSGAAGQAASRVDTGSLNLDPSAYLTDRLFRSERPAPNTGDNTASRAEVARIVAMSMRNGELTAGDRTYVASVIAAQTGISQQEAEKRIDDGIKQAKDAAAKVEQTARETAEAARSAAAKAALATFIAMIIGAMSASFFASLGGRARDNAV